MFDCLLVAIDEILAVFKKIMRLINRHTKRDAYEEILMYIQFSIFFICMVSLTVQVFNWHVFPDLFIGIQLQMKSWRMHEISPQILFEVRLKVHILISQMHF